jgi:ligand-binding sensor domain-containing protein
MMKLFALLLSGILPALTSCNGQTEPRSGNMREVNHTAAKGDTVQQTGNNIMLVYHDSKSNYWLGSWEDGVYQVKGSAIIHFTTKDGLPHNRINEIKEDKAGNIYFNTAKGISRFNGRQFTTLTETTGSDNDWKLNPDDLWFKSSEYPGYVCRFNGTTLFRLKLPKNKPGEDFILKNPNYPNPYEVYCVYNDSKGNIWFGTATLGVCRYNGKAFDWILEPDVTELHNGPANGVRSIAEDRDGYFWLNTNYRYHVYDRTTVNKSEQDSGVFYSREKSIGNLDGKKDSNLNEYLSIVRDNNNDLWIATYRNGVWKYDGAKVTHYPVQINSANITVFSIYKDNNGVLWLGTHENGAFKFNGQAFERFKP